MTATLTQAAPEQVMARAGKTFHQAARLLPARVRTEVTALYAFCRTVDDLADEPGRPLPERQRELLHLAEMLEGGQEEALRAAGWPFSSRGIMPQAAALLVRAALADLSQVQPATDEGVLGYAFGVAGTVGIMMAQVLGARAEGTGAAVALGMAMQLSNICRDVAEDLRAGRVYLPADHVPGEVVGLALSAGDAAAVERTREAIHHLLRLAEELYELAYDGMGSLPLRLRWSILAAALCYREIGVEVGRDVERSWRERTVVSRGRKLQLIALAALRLLHPRFWWPRRAAHLGRRLGGDTFLHAQRLGVLP